MICPGSTLGILGGGQLGRMTALAAARLGYRCHIFCPEDDAPALPVAAAHTRGAFTDVEALGRFADAVDVVTLEWENVPLEALRFLETRLPVHPGAECLRITQHRALEKEFAQSCGLGTAPFQRIASAPELAQALARLEGKGVLKSCRMGYDGKGQTIVTNISQPLEAWDNIGASEAILEEFVEFSDEISVIVARREDGAIACYPPVRNTHREHILWETRAPAMLDEGLADEARQAATRLANGLKLVGLLAVEMFVLRAPDAHGRRLLINELAPRPHNSGHWTLDACACSQFEQLVRAITGLPLGDATPHSGAIMRNLLGDDAKDVEALLCDPQACLHLYGKTEARKGRKMGHVTYLKGPWREKA